MDYLILALEALIVLSIIYYLMLRYSPKNTIVRKTAKLINKRLSKELKSK